MGGLTPGPSAAEPPRSSGTSRRRRITRRVRAGRVAVVVALAALRFPRAHAAKDRPRRRPSSSRSMRSGPRTLCHPPRAACGWPVRIELLLSKTGSHGARRSTSRAHSATAAGPAILQALVCISVVFGFTWWLGCGSGSAARAARRLCRSAASAPPSPLPVRYKRSASKAGVHGEPRGRLRPAVDLPWPAAANGLGLSQPVAGCDRRQHRHHSGRGALAGEQALQLATILQDAERPARRSTVSR